MKKNILPWLLSAFVAASAQSACGATPPDSKAASKQNPTSATSPSLPGAPKAAAGSVDESQVAARIAEWKLAPADIKEELEKSGRIVRSKQIPAGAPTGPMNAATITGKIKDRIKGDSKLSSLNLNVEAASDSVTLRGSASSLDQIGRAMALALDNDEVHSVTSEVKLQGGTAGTR